MDSYRQTHNLPVNEPCGAHTPVEIYINEIHFSRAICTTVLYICTFNCRICSLLSWYSKMLKRFSAALNQLDFVPSLLHDHGGLGFMDESLEGDEICHIHFSDTWRGWGQCISLVVNEEWMATSIAYLSNALSKSSESPVPGNSKSKTCHADAPEAPVTMLLLSLCSDHQSTPPVSREEKIKFNFSWRGVCEWFYMFRHVN